MEENIWGYWRFFLSDYFTDEFIKQWKRNANIPRCLKSETEKITKEIALEGGLYSQVVMIRISIMNIKFTEEASFKDKEKNIKISINSQIKYDKKRTVIM